MFKIISYINKFNLENVKSKLLILYILNVTDIIFTLLLLNTGFCIEVNTFMAKVVQNHYTSFIVKILLPAVLLLYIYLRIKKATGKQLKQSNVIINIALIVYAFINISHLICFLLLGWFKIGC